MKQLWKNLNSVCSFKHNKRKSTVVSKLVNNGVEIHSEYEISKCFNNYFSTIGEKLHQTNQKNTTNVSSDTFDKPVLNSMYCLPVYDIELSRLIHSLQSSKSPGPDEIGVSLIKEVSSIIVQPLAFIFNLSITNGVFPEQLKIAQVIPAYKKGCVFGK